MTTATHREAGRPIRRLQRCRRKAAITTVRHRVTARAPAMVPRGGVTTLQGMDTVLRRVVGMAQDPAMEVVTVVRGRAATVPDTPPPAVAMALATVADREAVTVRATVIMAPDTVVRDTVRIMVPIVTAKILRRAGASTR